MKINGKYYTVDWKKFREECVENAPDGYKFKKNEVKNIYRSAVGIYKKKIKEKRLANSH
tara:strand:- start:964 stop:1140 length:177 start_codon:yes stop_codon:yes gene_type:complete